MPGTSDKINSSDLYDGSQPLISVIIPTYNRLALLLEAIESVKKQTYINWELVIVDDGSTDGTVEKITSLNDDKIKVIPLTHAGHLGILRNEGVRNSSGKWLAFLDSDDIWLPAKLELQLKNLLGEKRRWAYTCTELIDENQALVFKPGRISRALPGWIVPEVINTSVDFCISSLMVEKGFFYEVGAYTTDVKLFCREDHDLTLRLALTGDASVVNEVLVQVRQHSNRTTNVLPDAFERSAQVYTSFLNYNSNKKFRKLARKRRAFHLSEAAVCRFKQGEYRFAFRQLGRSLKDGDNMRHWLSSVKRGMYAVGKRHF